MREYGVTFERMRLILGRCIISDSINIFTSVSVPRIARYSIAISSVCFLSKLPSFTELRVWRSATNMAASFHFAASANGRIAPMRFQRCIDEPVDLTQVMIFFIFFGSYDGKYREK
jgi:hypothetical protein